MSNFTKSILYSTTVLAAGLVAIFAIYNNVSTMNDGSSVAQISPAAGESSIGIQYEGAKNETSDVVNDATTAVLGAAEAAGSKINGAIETSESSLADAADAMAEAMDEMAPASGEEAVTEENHEAEDAVSEEEHVEESHAEENHDGDEAASEAEHTEEEHDEGAAH